MAVRQPVKFTAYSVQTVSHCMMTFSLYSKIVVQSAEVATFKAESACSFSGSVLLYVHRDRTDFHLLLDWEPR